MVLRNDYLSNLCTANLLPHPIYAHNNSVYQFRHRSFWADFRRLIRLSMNLISLTW